MSRIDREIEAWRGSLETSRTLTRDDVDELETHVRDGIEDLRQTGLTEREALWVALGRVGDPVAVATEYHKVNPGLPWARRWYWMTLGFILFTVGQRIVTVILQVAVETTRGNQYPMTVTTAWTPLLWLAAAIGVVSMVRASTSSSEGRLARLPRRALGWLDRRPWALAALTLLPVAWSGLAVSATARVASQLAGPGLPPWVVVASSAVAFLSLGLVAPALLWVSYRAMRKGPTAIDD